MQTMGRGRAVQQGKINGIGTSEECCPGQWGAGQAQKTVMIPRILPRVKQEPARTRKPSDVRLGGPISDRRRIVGGHRRPP